MTSSARFTVSAAIGLSLLFALKRIAVAETSPAETTSSRNLLAEGRALRERNDLDGALLRFEAADKLLHTRTTGLELAQTQAVVELLVEARETLARVSQIYSSRLASNSVPSRAGSA